MSKSDELITDSAHIALPKAGRFFSVATMKRFLYGGARPQTFAQLSPEAFRTSVETLFFFGQLPAIVITWGTLLVINQAYSVEGPPLELTFALTWGAASIGLSLFAVLRHRRSRRDALYALLISMVTTVVYLHF